MFRYFESAEIEMMRTVGLIYSGRTEYAFPRVHVECDFRLALIHDDEIEIEVFLTKLGKSSARFAFRTLKAGKLAADGAVVIVCMDRGSERAIPFPEEVRNKLQRLAAVHGVEP
jgi:acyl-CoA thioesterase FadM